MTKRILAVMLYVIPLYHAKAQQTISNNQPAFTATERKALIDTLLNKLDNYYVYPEMAKKMANAVRLHQQNHEYDTITERQVFASKLTADLQAISKDGHLGVDYSVTPITDDSPGEPSEEVVNNFRSTWARNNFNFKKVELLDGNIGLLQLDTFFPADWIKDLTAASMAFVVHADALIIDLRKNHGFAPDGVLLLESYFFTDAVHLTDSNDRHAKTTQQVWTMPTVPGTKLPGIDLYILVSKNTFSAPEDFTYNLQSQGRAKVIGETTGGGAHGTRPYKIGTYFTASIPFSYEVNTVTHTDWEGKGIQPDVLVPEDQTLLTAQLMAIHALIKRIPSETERVAELEKIAGEKESELAILKLKEGN